MNVSESPEFLKLKAESEIYARAAANSAVERQELIDLRAEMEMMKEKEAREQNIETGLNDYLQNNPGLFEMLLKKLKEEMIK